MLDHVEHRDRIVRARLEVGGLDRARPDRESEFSLEPLDGRLAELDAFEVETFFEGNVQEVAEERLVGERL